MRNASGYSVIINPGERAIEHDTFSCAHCGAITFTKGAWGQLQVLVVKRDGSMEARDVHKCFSCWEYICPRCVGKDCSPKLKQVEMAEKAAMQQLKDM